MLKINFSKTIGSKRFIYVLKQSKMHGNWLNACSMSLSSVAIVWRKRIEKFWITRWSVEISIFSKVDCQHTLTCCLKLKLSCKLSLSHNWAVVVHRANKEYVLRNAISRHFRRKINNNSQHNETAQKKKKHPTHWI